MALVSVSILNGDLARLAEVAQTVEAAQADMLHYDVMDGMFVDNISFGLPVLSCLKPLVQLPLDVHLMIEEPLRFAERFVKAGADLLSFHIESRSDAADTLHAIHSLGIPAGIAVSPETPEDSVFPLLERMQPEDFILMMTVHPGLGGQQFMEAVLPKITRLRSRITALQLPLHIEVDGGINAETGRRCRKAGADYLVAGSYVLGAQDPAAAVRSLTAPF
ncbi:MAG: ribulose-phosphate 3-epimerase [Oscillospiraceae bacterium]|nr:ribulose-phosphate 3-epimerase [Oscillospiraceae bacterium]